MITIGGRPRLKPGCRLSPTGDVLLIPEGALRLEGPASSILEACDGEKNVGQIVAALMEKFPAADQAKVQEETSTFLARLAERGFIELL